MTATPEAPIAAEERMLDLTRQSVATLDRIIDAVDRTTGDTPAARPCFVVRFVRLRPTKPHEIRLPLWEATGVAYPTLADALTGAAGGCWRSTTCPGWRSSTRTRGRWPTGSTPASAR